MKKMNFILHAFIPVLWIVMFFIANADWDLDYGSLCIFLWLVLPILIFIFNTFSETRFKRLLLLYLISAGIQIIGVSIHIFLYYHFISNDPGTSAVGLLAILITVVLNLVLSFFGIVIKGLILRFKKS